MAIDGEKMIPINYSDTGKFDEDSGLRLFRGMMTPWDKIKSFKETYSFLIRHASMFGVGLVNSLKIIEPDYEKRVSSMSEEWQVSMEAVWNEEDPAGMIAEFRERFAIPPFMKKGAYLAANYADKGDEMMLLNGHIWSATNERIEKELFRCDFDIIGPEACDVSVGGGQHFCHGIAGEKLNIYDPERKGCGDCHCHVVFETQRKYGTHPNADGHQWEQWGPTRSGHLKHEDHKPYGRDPYMRDNFPEWLDSGEFTAALGATFSAGEMYKDCAAWPMAYAFTAVDAIRALVSDEDMPNAMHIMDVVFETAGKIQFAEWNTKKAAREWLGVPESIEDGRVMGGYMSMIFQARSLSPKFLEFTEERTIIECDKMTMEMYGQYPEFVPCYLAYFNGMVKTLVNAQWVVELDESAPDEVARFVIKKGVYGFRRQKPGFAHEKEGDY